MLNNSQIREVTQGVFESLPSIAFALAIRSGADLETAGWVGSALAATILFGFYVSKVYPNPILLGINLHLLIITPLIVSTFFMGHVDVGFFLMDYSYPGVLITVFLVGLGQTLFSKGGLIGSANANIEDVKRYSYLLLIVNLLAIALVFSGLAHPAIGVVIAFVVIFGIRRYLLQRINKDQS